MLQLANGKQQFLDQNGAPLAGGLVYHYAPGTSNPVTTYKDSAGTSANTNPIQLDSRGQAVIWGTGSFRQVVTDAFNVQIWDQVVNAPDINAPSNSLASQLLASSGSSLVGFTQSGAGAVGRTVQDKLRESVISVKDFGAKGDGTTDDLASIQAAIDSLPNGGVIHLPQPANKYRITQPLNLYKAGMDSSKTIELRGESDLNTVLYLDNPAGGGIITYDSGSKRIDVGNCSIVSGSNTLTTTSNFITAGVTVGCSVLFDGLSQFAQVTAVSAGSVTLSENAAGNGGVATATFYKFVPGTNRVKIRNLFLKNSFAYSAYTAWHPGTGIYLNGAYDSEIENVRVEGFTKGVYWFGGYISKAANLYATTCLWGIWLEVASYGSVFERVTSVNNGAAGNGAGIYLLSTGGIAFNDLILEDSNQGLIVENVRGLTITGGNVETQRNYGIVLRGLSTSSKAYQNLWTSGVNITGMRWYTTLGLYVDTGVKGVKFYNHTFESAPDYNPGSTRPCINYRDGNENLIQDIDYGGCMWYPSYPVTLHTNLRNTNLPSAQSFTQNGVRYCDDAPYYGKFWKKGMTLQNLTTDAGSFGAYVCVADANGVADGTSVWGVNGQNGYRTNAGTPVAVVTPKFIGERLLDTTGKKWWTSTALTSADWA